MSTQSSPTLRRRRLARKVRQMREGAGLTLDEAARRLDKTRSALQRVESANTVADVHLVRSMMDVYDRYEDGLLDLARQAMRPGWWQAFGIKDRGFIGLETEAVRSLEVSLMHIPGLLQTEGYMRALFTSVREPMRKRFENDISVRLIRQERLTDPDAPLSLTALVDESALRKNFGGPDVMRAQLRYILARMALDTVTFQILPDSVGGHDGMDGAFTLLEFADQDDPTVLYSSYVSGAIHQEKPAEVQEARLAFESTRAKALSPADSIDMLKRYAGDW